MSARSLGLVATGGTISMLVEEGGRRRPALAGRDLFEALPGGLDVGMRYYQPYKIASHEVTFAHWQRLAATVHDALAENDGVVVIHGTDTMEEAAFFLAECLDNPNVVLLGAMRPAGLLGEDGPRNLRDAVIVGSRDARTGVCVCMNRELFPAWSVTKRDTVAFNAFESRIGGRLGIVHGDQVHFESSPIEANWLGSQPDRPISAKDIALVALAADPSPGHVIKLLDGAAAVLVEAIATGSIPRGVRRELVAAAADVPVVVTTRCYTGPVHDEEDYPHAWDDLIAAGIHLENRIDTYKARVRLALSLALGRSYRTFEILPPPGTGAP